MKTEETILKDKIEKLGKKLQTNLGVGEYATILNEFSCANAELKGFLAGKEAERKSKEEEIDKELEEEIKFMKEKELKDKKEITSLIALFIGTIIILIPLTFYTNDLKSQLEECKNPQEVWTLKYECDWGETNYTASYEFKDYNKYLEQVELMKSVDCEEIK